MSFMMRKLYKGFLYKPDTLHLHPFWSLVVLDIQFLLLIVVKLPMVILLSFVIVIENIAYKNLRGMVNVIKTIYMLVLFIGVITLLFSSVEETFLIVLRFLASAFMFSLFFATTNPSDLARTLEKLHLPTKWAMLPALTLTLVPRVSKDAEETLEALMLRGELDGFFLTWLPKSIAIFVASILYRSEYLTQALYFRGFAIQKRSHYRSVSVKWKDLVRILYWLAITSLVLFI